jgi:hypothetical protein
MDDMHFVSLIYSPTACLPPHSYGVPRYRPESIATVYQHSLSVYQSISLSVYQSISLSIIYLSSHACLVFGSWTNPLRSAYTFLPAIRFPSTLDRTLPVSRGAFMNLRTVLCGLKTIQLSWPWRKVIHQPPTKAWRVVLYNSAP